MCFACGPENPIGLHIRFVLDGDVCRGRFTPTVNHVGWSDTVHGGIIYSALDDVTANLLYLQGRKAHTARCEIRYRDALRVGESVTLLGRIVKEKGRLVQLVGEATRDSDRKLIADCEASFILSQ